MMASVMGTVSKIRLIMRLRQMLSKWRNNARYSPHGIPAGHVAIVAGREGCDRRFVVRATYLNHLAFAKLLSEVEEEYGFGYDGPQTIPCDESAFEDVIRIVPGYGQDIGWGKAGDSPCCSMVLSRNRSGRTKPWILHFNIFNCDLFA